MITEDEVLEQLRKVIDPDVGINVVDLGLVAEVNIRPDTVWVGLIMTTPACPQSSYIQDQAAALLGMAVDADTEVMVDVLEDPLWQPDRMSASAKATLGWPG